VRGALQCTTLNAYYEQKSGGDELTPCALCPIGCAANGVGDPSAVDVAAQHRGDIIKGGLGAKSSALDAEGEATAETKRTRTKSSRRWADGGGHVTVRFRFPT